VQDDTLYCWGANDDGQLGDGTEVTSATPRQVAGLSGAPIQLKAGDRTSCAVYADSAQCWGNMFSPTPETIANVKGVGAGDRHVCTIQPDNTVLCYGNGQNYQLGQSAQEDAVAPGVQAVGVTSASELFGRGNQSCALISDGTAKCWGLNENVRLGVGGDYHTETPSPVMGLSSIMQFAMGYEASCALKTDGTISCWGHNYFGQVGDTTYQDRGTPVQLLSLSNVKEVASGQSHACAIDGDGKVWCWGSGARGQLGNGRHLISRPVGVRMTCP
jgi:alpha-tubulin suppressor-like RCC1 family protein